MRSWHVKTRNVSNGFKDMKWQTASLYQVLHDFTWQNCFKKPFNGWFCWSSCGILGCENNNNVHQTKPNQKPRPQMGHADSWNKHLKLKTRVSSSSFMFGIGREDLAYFSWIQPTSSSLLLIQLMHVAPLQSRQKKMDFQWCRSYYQEALLQQRHNVPNKLSYLLC